MKSKLLVIGGASSDILHILTGTIPSAGGAGMYTAMAAWRCGTPVTLFAPKPDPMPATLLPVGERLDTWLGPTISPADLAHFEISYLDGQTNYLDASVGAEAALTPDQLPDDLTTFGCVHIIPLGSTRRQLDFIHACRHRGARRISVGNHLSHIQYTPSLVQEVIREADYCFMNEKEALGLFGDLDHARTQPGKVLFITLGALGCLVIQGAAITRLFTQPVTPLDPTGAGDTFCGAVLSRLLEGSHPILAARSAMPLAAEMTQHPGPSDLLLKEDPPKIQPDSRVSIHPEQTVKIARMIATLPDAQPFPFTGAEYPPAGHPAALDFFFASTLQQFGFWTARNGCYEQPLVAKINGSLQKGSSYLFHAYLRAVNEDPEILRPERQAWISETEMHHLLRSDDGTDPMPAFELHLALARQYGSDMLALGLTPEKIIQQSQASPTPMRAFLEHLDQIGGYKEDPLRKKSSLLALILSQRPEGFLTPAEDELVAPVIDYHLMRSCLRTGLIEIQDPSLRDLLIARQELSPEDEWAVRWAAFRAIEQVVELSGKSMGAVDWFFFNSRRRCPEMSDPICANCPIDPVCAHYKELFQPVLRTTFY